MTRSGGSQRISWTSGIATTASLHSFLLRDPIWLSRFTDEKQYDWVRATGRRAYRATNATTVVINSVEPAEMDANHAALDELPNQTRRRASSRTTRWRQKSISSIERYEISMPRKFRAVCEISRPDTIALWLRGDLNLQAKLLILLRWIPAPNEPLV